MKWKEDHDNSNDNLQTFVTAKIFTLLYAQIQINLNVLPPISSYQLYFVSSGFGEITQKQCCCCREPQWNKVNDLHRDCFPNVQVIRVLFLGPAQLILGSLCRGVFE